MTLQAINAGDKYETQSVPDEDGELVEQEVLVGNTYIESAIESSKATLRRSLDGSKTILKWDGETPEVFEGMDTYTHAEILEELAGPAWTSNEEPGQAAVSSQSYVKYRAKSSAQERLAELPEGHGITALRSTKTFGGSAIILSNDSQRQYLNAEELEDLEPVGDEEWVEWLARYAPEAP
jgi:hypothetical protein